MSFQKLLQLLLCKPSLAFFSWFLAAHLGFNKNLRLHSYSNDMWTDILKGNVPAHFFKAFEGFQSIQHALVYNRKKYEPDEMLYRL